MTAPTHFSKMRLGFEAECVFSNEKLGESSVAAALSRSLGPTAPIADHLKLGKATGLSYSQWNLVDDSTIESSDTDTPVEIVSPVLSYPKFSQAVSDTFNCIKQYGSTNSSCGFHVGASLDGVDLQEHLDVMKLIVFIGEAHVAQMFERFDNEYAKLLSPFVSEYLGSFYDVEEHINEIVDRPLFPATLNVDAVIPWDKYFSLNLTKIKDHNYVEFRLMGGEGYHLRTDDVLAVSRRIGWAVAIACDPTAHKEEYIQKLLSLAQTARMQNKKEPAVKIKHEGDDKYLVTIAPPANAHSLVHKEELTLTSNKTNTGAVLTNCSQDHLPKSYHQSVYQLLAYGVGGLRFSISVDPSKQLTWAIVDMLETLDPAAKLFLVTACPSVFYIIASSSAQEIARSFRPLLTDHGSRAAINRALSKCDINHVAKAYDILNVFPVHEDPEHIVWAFDSAGVDMDEFSLDNLSVGTVGPLDVAAEAFAYIDTVAYKYKSIGKILELIFSSLDAPKRLPVEHATDLVQLVLEQCDAPFNLEHARNTYLDQITESMAKLPVSKMPFLRNLIEIGLAYKNEFVLDLAHALAGRNVDKSWRDCLYPM